MIINPDDDDTSESSDDYDDEDMNGVGPPSSDCVSNSVQTNSLISLPNSQPTVLLGSKSYVFIKGGSAGEALFRVRMVVMGCSLQSPPSRRVVPSHSNWTLPLGAPEIHPPQVGQQRPVEWAISVGDGC
jgi:hypothetical protein